MTLRFSCRTRKTAFSLILLVLLAACSTPRTTPVDPEGTATTTPMALKPDALQVAVSAAPPATTTMTEGFILYTYDCGLYAAPLVAALDDPAMRSIYSAVTDCAYDLPRYFIGYAPLLSPDARRLLVTNPYETWVADFTTGQSRRLLSEQVAATWNPTGDQITYVSGDKLYTSTLGASNPPQVLFQHPNLIPTFARWSPDEKWIATVTITNTPDGTSAVGRMWAIPAKGGTAQELGSFPVPPMDFAPQDVRWSPDSQTIGTWTGWLFPLNGSPQQTDLNTVSWWEPAQARRLIGNQVDPKWAFSRDGQRLVYTTPASNGAEVWSIATSSGTATLLGTVPSTAAPRVIRSSPDERAVFIGLNDATVWRMSVAGNTPSARVLSGGDLIDIVPSPR